MKSGMDDNAATRPGMRPVAAGNGLRPTSRMTWPYPLRLMWYNTGCMVDEENRNYVLCRDRAAGQRDCG